MNIHRIKRNNSLVNFQSLLFTAPCKREETHFLCCRFQAAEAAGWWQTGCGEEGSTPTLAMCVAYSIGGGPALSRVFKQRGFEDNRAVPSSPRKYSNLQYFRLFVLRCCSCCIPEDRMSLWNFPPSMSTFCSHTFSAPSPPFSLVYYTKRSNKPHLLTAH